MGHGNILNDYFIVPSNMMIIMHTHVENLAYTHDINQIGNDNPFVSNIRNIISNNIVPPCYINKNYNEYINSIFKINPIVYLSGSLIKNNYIQFYETDKYFKSFLGIFNIEQLTNEQFILPPNDIEYIINWNNNNIDNNNDDNIDFRLKYTDTNILTIEKIKQNNFTFKFNNIVSKIKNKFPNKKIILHIIACRICMEYNDYMEDICPTEIQKISIMKTNNRGSFSLDTIDIDTLQQSISSDAFSLNTIDTLDSIENDILQSMHNKFQDIFNFVINNSSNINNIINNYYIKYTLSNTDICDILKEYIRLKNL